MQFSSWYAQVKRLETKISLLCLSLCKYLLCGVPKSEKNTKKTVTIAFLQALCMYIAPSCWAKMYITNSPNLPTCPRSRVTLKPRVLLLQIYHLMHRYKFNEKYKSYIYAINLLLKRTSKTDSAPVFNDQTSFSPCI